MYGRNIQNYKNYTSRFKSFRLKGVAYNMLGLYLHTLHIKLNKENFPFR